MFCKKPVLRNFAIFTGKHLSQSLFFNKVATLVHVFSCGFCEISKNTFLHRTPLVATSKKPTLRQIEWGIQNGLITKNGALPVTTLFFQKLCFSLRTSYKKLIWCTNYVHIHTFWKGRSFIWGCFYPVSILKVNNKDTRTTSDDLILMSLLLILNIFSTTSSILIQPDKHLIVQNQQ